VKFRNALDGLKTFKLIFN